MVGRRLNKPIGKVIGKPLFWLYEVVGTNWSCRACRTAQPKGSVTFEVFVETGSIEIPSPFQGGPPGKHKTGTKAYLCLDCAIKLLEEAKDKAETCKKMGPSGYAMFDEM